MVSKNEQGIVYGMTYIDFKNKVVFNGSDLGAKKAFAAFVRVGQIMKMILTFQKVILF